MQSNTLNFERRRSYECTDLSTNRTTQQVGPSTVKNYFHRPASFCKRHIRISSGCKQTVIRIQKNHGHQKNSTFKSKHSRTTWNESTPGHGMQLQNVIVSHCIHQNFRVLKQHLWGSCPFHLSSGRSSRRCEWNVLRPWLLPGSHDLGSHSSQRCNAADLLQRSDA